MMRPALLLAFLLAVASGAAQDGKSRTEDSSLAVPVTATGVERGYDGHKFSEGCQRIKYTVNTPYSGGAVLDFLFRDLRTHNWKPVQHVSRRFLPSPGVTKSLRRWEHWVSAANGVTYVRAEQWRNEQGDLTSYILWYTTPDHSTMEVVGRRCPSEVVSKFRCTKAAEMSKLSNNERLEVEITKVEQVGNDYKVSAKLRNSGDERILLALNGELDDGSPELWVLHLQQQVGPDRWLAVDNICREHPAFDLMVLKPGDEVSSWVMAVDVSKRDPQQGMCRRTDSTPLGGNIRASIGYYIDACEFEHPFDAPVRVAISPSVNLPGSKN